MYKWIFGYGLLWLLLLHGCAPYLPPPEGHVSPAKPIVGEIPKPVPLSPFLKEPTPSVKQERYSVVVTDVPVKELLFALARDANLNLDLHGGLSGTVTLNAIDQSLPRILERVAQQVDLRFEIDRDNLIITPDHPYLHTYKVDYVNLNRDTATQVQITSQVTDVGGGGTGGAGNNNSSVTVNNKSANDFWTKLENNVRTILGLPPITAGAAEAPATTGSSNAERPLVLSNPVSGLLTVRASRKQHREIQSFLDHTLLGAKRQVRIEATVAEVILSDQYKAGIDWSWLSSGGAFTSNAMAQTTSQVPTLATGTLIPLTTQNLGIQANLLSRFGDVKVLSTPKLVTLNNQVAVLKVVDNEIYFTIEITRGQAATATSPATADTFTSELHTVPIGLTMHIIPQISDNNEVTLIVRPTITRILDKVQDPNPALVTQSGEIVESLVPRVQVREMESILRIRNKQVAVIGGLMQDENRTNKAGLPGLSKVPGLGNLFGLGEDESRKTELVIFLKPTVLEEQSDLVMESDQKTLEASQSRIPPLLPQWNMGGIP